MTSSHSDSDGPNGPKTDDSQRVSDPVRLDGGELGVLEFDWHGDRYQHRWTFPQTTASVESVESPSSELWPDSPPLQQIHSQSFGDGREVIFGVGMAGRGHWSASFTLVPELHCWIVELACRCPQPVERLNNSYLLQPPWQPLADNQFGFVEQDTQLIMEATAPSSVARSLGGNLVRFEPASIESGQATTQWAFRLRVVSSR